MRVTNKGKTKLWKLCNDCILYIYNKLLLHLLLNNVDTNLLILENDTWWKIKFTFICASWNICIEKQSESESLYYISTINVKPLIWFVLHFWYVSHVNNCKGLITSICLCSTPFHMIDGKENTHACFRLTLAIQGFCFNVIKLTYV